MDASQVPSAAVRKHWRVVLDNVYHHNVRYIVERYKTRMAVIISWDDWERFQKLEEEARLASEEEIKKENTS